MVARVASRAPSRSDPAAPLDGRPGRPPPPAGAAGELERLERACAGLQAPFACVDLDALRANAADMLRRAAPKPIRVASKSVRCRSILRDVLRSDPRFHGILAFTLPEALWLGEHGFEDLLVAYPTADRHALARLAEVTAERPDGRITLMVDSTDQLDLAGPAAQVAAAAGSELRVCLDVDASWRPARGRIRIGARRSPVRTPGQAAALAREVLARPGLALVGLMSYEAQIAGVGDDPPGNPLMGAGLRVMQRASARELARRRAEVVAAVRAVAPLELVNGGGTGSLERTASEPAVTEVAAGSGLYGPALFDAYRAFTPRPAALFALPVVRRPAPEVATVLGGGYPASGAPAKDRLPRPHLPPGLRLDGQEAAGEVQTPLLGVPAARLAIGDRVWFRHAKAGELCERFDTLHLIEGDRVVDAVPTYRGESRCFL
jgi:D-serine deaminase-like pyridoxal phosphate-dependent protein